MKPHEYEARLLLGTAVNDLDRIPGMKQRKAAAEKLADEFVALSKAQGLNGGTLKDVPSVRYVGVDSKRVQMEIDAGGAIYLSQQTLGRQVGDAVEAKLDYDCVQDCWVGANLANVAPTPGERLAREHGVVELARIASGLLK